MGTENFQNPKFISKEELEKQISELKYGLIRKHGVEYEKYYDMSFEECKNSYEIASAHEYKLREICADRHRIEKRKNGINCKCTHTMICKRCGVD